MKAGGNSLKNTHADLHSPQTGAAREARLLIQCCRCCFGGWSFVTILFVFRLFLSPVPHPASPLHFGLPWFCFLEVGCGHRDGADISPPPLPPSSNADSAPCHRCRRRHGRWKAQAAGTSEACVCSLICVCSCEITDDGSWCLLDMYPVPPLLW